MNELILICNKLKNKKRNYYYSLNELLIAVNYNPSSTSKELSIITNTNNSTCCDRLDALIKHELVIKTTGLYCYNKYSITSKGCNAIVLQPHHIDEVVITEKTNSFIGIPAASRTYDRFSGVYIQPVIHCRNNGHSHIKSRGIDS